MLNCALCWCERTQFVITCQPKMPRTWNLRFSEQIIHFTCLLSFNSIQFCLVHAIKIAVYVTSWWRHNNFQIFPESTFPTKHVAKKNFEPSPFRWFYTDFLRLKILNVWLLVIWHLMTSSRQVICVLYLTIQSMPVPSLIKIQGCSVFINSCSILYYCFILSFRWRRKWRSNTKMNITKNEDLHLLLSIPVISKSRSVTVDFIPIF